MTTEASESGTPADLVHMVDQFVRRHGAEAFTAVVEKVDDFLSAHKMQALDELLGMAPLFGDLMVRSRRNVRNALDGVLEGEDVWLILTHDGNKSPKPRERLEVRSVVGHCGPIKISFEDTVGGSGR